ncbi:hypothetical protein ABZU75_04530 [Streptosporangium sp. NPDC005286]|uniref:hypothetical protein n=1 Tax=Streptosporangium sp. NPDC005286 TaxID=3154463 RepID=UPI0033B9269F
MINDEAVGRARFRGLMFTCEIRRRYGAGRSRSGCPAGDFDHGGDRTGRYRTAPADADSRISYADFAIALLDEIDTPKHHRTYLGVEQG